MARNWLDDLARVNRNTNVKEGDPIPAANILQAMDDADVPKEEQARILGTFMEVNKDSLGGPAADKPETTLTLQQMIAMAQDPSKRRELQTLWASLPEDKKRELFAQIEALRPAEVAKPDAAYNAALVQPVTNAVSKIESIVAAALPKRTKMLDIIQVLNSVIPTPALQIKDKTGVTYADKILKILSQNTDKFGTIETPGDKFVKLLTPSIQTNKPITLPQTALESQLRQLKKAAGII